MKTNLADKLFIGFLFFAIFLFIYEWRREVQWQKFVKENDCKIVREIDNEEVRYLCKDGFVYVR